MVKGVAKRVVVIKSPDPRVFEQALFILREDIKNPEGMTGEELVNQAQHLAVQCMRRRFRRRRIKLSGLTCMLIGAVISSALWCLAAILL